MIGDKTKLQEAEIISEKKVNHKDKEFKKTKPTITKQTKIFITGVLLPIGILSLICLFVFIESIIRLSILNSNPMHSFYSSLIAFSFISFSLSTSLFIINLLLIVKKMNDIFYKKLDLINAVIVSFLITFLLIICLTNCIGFKSFLALLSSSVLYFGLLSIPVTIYLLINKDVFPNVK